MPAWPPHRRCPIPGRDTLRARLRSVAFALAKAATKSTAGPDRGAIPAEPHSSTENVSPRTQDDGALDDVLQLANVSGPVVGLKQLQCLLPDVPDPLPGLFSLALDQIPDQERNVFHALAQRRDPDREDIEPVIEILAEGPAATAAARSRFVAASTRTSTVIGWLLPTRSNSRSWSTRNTRSASRREARRSRPGRSFPRRPPRIGPVAAAVPR